MKNAGIYFIKRLNVQFYMLATDNKKVNASIVMNPN